ncbi:uncharacterized protein TRIADDRAFT_63612 [Trichoplax adhaerens]|uniref:Methyltransferase type 12 domain-containing protein n=1 Tax=Trichoplax adhaerens TaxID=10228 RepID=B3RN34_TRIAD|nr:hypothetical protein TRIADDRAFT_63612 [Trichoplax adhaerens]EDV27383.1 hypothetical protein TRIADDRAFT_63612 [Trichoplax adhaerens]|eukprot:XP_002109217.1 hypothetical protein TRIADDRAFT_63612 [Trichoplax adhaerens]
MATHWFSASERNKHHICDVLKQVLNSNDSYSVAEVASGHGQHICFFAKEFRQSVWSPTEINAEYLNRLTENVNREQLSNVKPAVLLDASWEPSRWKESLSVNGYDLVININMVHISPFEATIGLFNGAASILKQNGYLLLYGPYAIHGVISPESNVKFHHWLKSKCTEWGLRDIFELETLAHKNNMVLEKTIDMPANNKILLFRKLSA